MVMETTLDLPGRFNKRIIAWADDTVKPPGRNAKACGYRYDAFILCPIIHEQAASGNG